MTIQRCGRASGWQNISCCYNTPMSIMGYSNRVDNVAINGGGSTRRLSAKAPDFFDSPAQVRITSIILLGLFGTMLGIGLYVNPNPHGLSTHTQLGLPPCGFYTSTRVPCPTCGYTTAVSHVAHGQWLAAILTQPAGATVGFLALAATIIAIAGLTTGQWYGPSLFFLSWNLRRLVIGALLLVLLGWGYKVLVMSHWFRLHG